MLCRKPFYQGVLPFGCGQCMPCRFNRRRLWTHRLLLEQLKHADSSFITLTYDEQHYPPTGSLSIRDYQLFLKRLRKRWPTPIRYFFVGEYGEHTQRAHYHAALFGVPPEATSIVNESWRKGFVYAGDLTKDSASYIAGYVTKKMTRHDDPRLLGRYPEFARMSLKPGIGAIAIDDIANSLFTDAGCELIIREGDAPSQLQHGLKKMPLGRYLKGKLREALNIPEEEAKALALQKWSLQVSQLHEDIQSDPQGAASGYKKHIAENSQKVLNLISKQKTFTKRGTL